MTEPISPPRGRLKIYLGYAAGVGKTYQMLTEVHELKRQGVDAVVGYFEPHGRQATIALMDKLELIPRRKITYRGTDFEEMDSAAILRRHPQTCAIDEFPHTNVPGAERVKRWEDVQEMLNAGINVITTMNVQHIESLNDHIRGITGVRVRETIPDWVVRQANEVVMVDLPPEALLNRLRRGVVYKTEKAEQAMQNFFKESTLVVLRELTLRQTAHEIDIRHSEPEENLRSRAQAGSEGGVASGRDGQPPDRILIYVTPHPATAMLIRRGRRVADYLKADCFAVSVQNEKELVQMPAAQRAALDKHLNFARNLHIETQIIAGENAAQALVEFARSRQITQIFLVRPPRRLSLPFLSRDIVQQVVRLARDIQVNIVAERERAN
ncbi:MAG TPA: histidine kinase [Terriglobia bacterium]|nr:histidine kinase [Terriglobia bacterium]